MRNSLRRPLAALPALLRGHAAGEEPFDGLDHLVVHGVRGVEEHLEIELARVGGFDQTILVGIIDDLESRGWVTRQQHQEDRRRRVLQITKSGRGALADLLSKALENERPARKALNAAEMKAFQKALDDIFHALI